MQKVHENKALAVKPCIAEIEILQTQNAPNHPGLCRTKLDKCLSGAGVKHATHATRNHFCHLDLSPCDVHKKRQNVTCQQGLRVAVGRGAIPCHLQSHCAEGLGHGMVTAGKNPGVIT